VNYFFKCSIGLILLLGFINATEAASGVSEKLFLTSPVSLRSYFQFSDSDRTPSAQTDVSRLPDRWLGVDKAEHFLISFWLAGSGLAILKATRNNEDQSSVSCFGVTLGLGFAKEIYDLYHPKTHQASFKDLTADLLGACSGILFARSI
jgi:uncharacterized protein YfiM (DUF2279 family)